MVIGSSGAFDTRLPTDECGRRLNSDRSADSYVGDADSSGFQLSLYGRTAVRIRGSFTSLAGGCRVSYRIEFKPWLLWALAVSFLIEVPILAMLVMRGLVPASVVLWVAAITAIVLPLNVWFSERQAQRMKDYITAVLSAT
jgi:hypothetical protein